MSFFEIRIYPSPEVKLRAKAYSYDEFQHLMMISVYSFFSVSTCSHVITKVLYILYRLYDISAVGLLFEVPTVMENLPGLTKFMKY